MLNEILSPKLNMIFPIFACVLFGTSLIECCNRIKYSAGHENSKIFYIKEASSECNGESIYRAIDKQFAIYKPLNGSYWCDSFIASNHVACFADCSQIRFKFEDIYSEKGAVIEEYASGEWIQSLYDEVFKCEDAIVSEPITEDFASETTANEVMNEVTTVTNNDDPFESSHLFISTSTSTTSTTLTSLPSTSSTTMSTSIRVIKKCPRIELHYSFIDNLYGAQEDDLRSINIEFELFFGVECRGYPVYKAISSDIYLFRNIHGEWCKDYVSTFQINVHCVKRCANERLSPVGISSPTASHSIEYLDPETSNVISNQIDTRFTCINMVSCKFVGCFNGGSCISFVLSNGVKSYKCVCPSKYTGSLCEQKSSRCKPDTCLNNGTCIDQENKKLACFCQNGYIGQRCEKTTCKLRQCENGGTCVINHQHTYGKCKCPMYFYGDFCQTFSDNICLNKNVGDLLSHPGDPNAFIVCLNDGLFKIQTCPSNLVFNRHMKRCDYSHMDSTDLCECQNDGICEISDNGETNCACPAGFTGRKCEINIDECESIPCGPKGKCTDLINGWICLCENNFYGLDCLNKKVPIPCDKKIGKHLYPFDTSIMVECDGNGNVFLNKCPSSLYWNPFKGVCTYEPIDLETPRECLNFGCKNGAKCLLNKDSKPICLCPTGFNGRYCENNIDDCLNQPCMNNSTCVDGINSYYCLCTNYFVDKDCNTVSIAYNPCRNGPRQKRSPLGRFSHPFSQEKFIVCSPNGYAHVIPCPHGLIWNKEFQTCVEKDSDYYEIYKKTCQITKKFDTLYPYEFSKLKYVKCLPSGTYIVGECQTDQPFFCEKSRKCISDLRNEC